MRVSIRLFCFIICTITCTYAWARPPGHDAFTKCLSNATDGTMYCSSGCGMIVRSCYEQEKYQLENEAEHLVTDIKKKNGDVCASFASLYLKKASGFADDMISQADKEKNNLDNGELIAFFAKQHLDTIKLIEKTCVDIK